MLNQTHKDFMLGALLGGTAGAAAALLLTPVSGTKLREKMAPLKKMVPLKKKKIRTKVARRTSRKTLVKK